MRNILKSIGMGIKDATPILSSIKENLSTDHTGDLKGFGKVDLVRLLTAFATISLLIAFLSGKITLEDLKFLLNFVPTGE